jgi:MOSC domain-containing protein YiiM
MNVSAGSAGRVVAIHISPTSEGTMTAVDEVRAVPGQGLEGDRYFLGVGSYSDRPEPSREVTLIESEALEALTRDYGCTLPPGASRRNITTAGMALNHLVGQEFRIGEVRLRGIRLCEPCNHLEAVTGQEVRPGLVHRGGLRCQILTEGQIKTGDPIGS